MHWEIFADRGRGFLSISVDYCITPKGIIIVIIFVVMLLLFIMVLALQSTFLRLLLFLWITWFLLFFWFLLLFINLPSIIILFLNQNIIATWLINIITILNQIPLRLRLLRLLMRLLFPSLLEIPSFLTRL